MSFFKIFDFRGARNTKPDIVLDVRPDDYATCNVLYREDSLVLYELSEPARKSNPTSGRSSYELVLHKELSRSAATAFSVYRFTELEEAEMEFATLREKLPLLQKVNPDITKEIIQEVVDLSRKNGSWTLAHIAAHMGSAEVLKNPALKKWLDDASNEAQQTPLHIAIKEQKLQAVLTLVQLDCNIEAVDNNADTMYHCAAITNKDIIKALSTKPVPSGLINRRNKEGYTPLQLACLTDRVDCVKELLKEGADVNSASAGIQQDENTPKCLGKTAEVASNFQEEDMKHGGTPLHWAKSTGVLESMIEYGCDLNARNFQDNTALHIMAARSRLNCVVLLLSHGADVNAIGMDGETPLHVAVRVAAPATDNWLPLFEQGDVSIIQALIIFGADVNALNHKGESPRHLAALSKTSKRDPVLYTLHAVGAARCTDDIPNCTDGCSALGCFDGIAHSKLDFFKSTPLFDSLLGELVIKDMLENCADTTKRGRQCRALALDGGGVKGLIIIRMMMSLEELVKRPIIECFDWIVGTSTGGVLALCLTTGKSTTNCFQMYFRLKEKVFTGNRPYSSEPLENLLKQELGENSKMSDIEYPRLAITAVIADRHPAKLHLFRNYMSPRQIIQNNHDEGGDEAGSNEQLLWHVARATGAAPTFFNPYLQYVDGGLISNNPTQDLLTEIIEYNAVQKAIEADSEVANLQVVVSMGTGKPPVTPVATIGSLQGSGLLGVAKMAYSANSLFQLVVDEATQTCGRVVDRTQAWCHSMGVPYFRLNPEQSEDLSLNESDNKKIVPVLWETMVYMRNRQAELRQLAQLLQPCDDSPSLRLQPKE